MYLAKALNCLLSEICRNITNMKHYKHVHNRNQPSQFNFAKILVAELQHLVQCIDEFMIVQLMPSGWPRVSEPCHPCQQAASNPRFSKYLKNMVKLEIFPKLGCDKQSLKIPPLIFAKCPSSSTECVAFRGGKTSHHPRWGKTNVPHLAYQHRHLAGTDDKQLAAVISLLHHLHGAVPVVGRLDWMFHLHAVHAARKTCFEHGQNSTNRQIFTKLQGYKWFQYLFSI